MRETVLACQPPILFHDEEKGVVDVARVCHIWQHHILGYCVEVRWVCESSCRFVNGKWLLGWVRQLIVGWKVVVGGTLVDTEI